jgi:uncharacterized protein (TIGR03067 family)
MRLDGHRLTLRGPDWGTTLQSGPYVDNEFTLKLNTRATPNEIDLARITVEETPPTFVLGVYELKGDELRVCLGLESVERPTGLKTRRSRSEALLVLKRNDKAKWTPLGKGFSPPISPDPKSGQASSK